MARSQAGLTPDDILILLGDLVEKGRGIELFPGVEDWFRRIDAFGGTQPHGCFPLSLPAGGQSASLR